MPLDYLVLRAARHYMPAFVPETLMGLRIGIVPGLETRDPGQAVERYREGLSKIGRTVQGGRVLILGFGGYYGVAVHLLRLGVQVVHLVDPFAREKSRANARVAREFPEYFMFEDRHVVPREEYIRVHETDVRKATRLGVSPFDMVLSSSVLEHLDDPAEVIAALAAVTDKSGVHLHYVDLRDHYFRHPFEMLCYSKDRWERFLNPRSNLNRWRIWNYKAAFEEVFGEVDIRIMSSNLPGFDRVKHRIRPEFTSGQRELDAATRIAITASEPKTHAPASRR